jgi:hypothetical protein
MSPRITLGGPGVTVPYWLPEVLTDERYDDSRNTHSVDSGDDVDECAKHRRGPPGKRLPTRAALYDT